MRSTGAQFYSCIMYFVAYFLVGIPIGLSFMFLASLKSAGI